MRPFLATSSLLAAGLLRAADPLIGTWHVVWASVTYDNPPRITVARTKDGLSLIEKGKPARPLRRLDGNTAEYTSTNGGQTTSSHFAVRAEGQELTERTRHGMHDHFYIYDRIKGTEDKTERLAGDWVYNWTKGALREGSRRIFEVTETEGLRFSGGGMTYAGAFDGRDYPVTGSSSGAKTVTLRRIDGGTFEEVFKGENGKELNVRRVAASADGTELTFTHVGTFAFGSTPGRGYRILILRKNQ